MYNFQLCTILAVYTARLHCSSVSSVDKCVLLPSTYLSRARLLDGARRRSREKGERKKEGNGAIKRQSQASNFQVICFHDAGKMFRFTSFCRHVLAPYFQSQSRCCCSSLSLSLTLSLPFLLCEDILRNNYGNGVRSDGNFIVSSSQQRRMKHASRN